MMDDTVLNERDIILGYLGVKRPNKTHCNTDCTNIKCESYCYNKRLPSAQPETKTGRLEYVDYGGVGNYHCTACGKICICNGDYDFCPNCGAKMMKDGDTQ